MRAGSEQAGVEERGVHGPAVWWVQVTEYGPEQRLHLRGDLNIGEEGEPSLWRREVISFQAANSVSSSEGLSPVLLAQPKEPSLGSEDSLWVPQLDLGRGVSEWATDGLTSFIWSRLARIPILSLAPSSRPSKDTIRCSICATDPWEERVGGHRNLGLHDI
jgi:hypothetical protein